jgi:hypothetical protein
MRILTIKRVARVVDACPLDYRVKRPALIGIIDYPIFVSLDLALWSVSQMAVVITHGQFSKTSFSTVSPM